MIRQYYSGASPSLVDSAGSAVLLFTSTNDGSAGGTSQRMAITTIAMCNTGTVDLNDETSDSVTVDLYVVPQGDGASDENKIVHQLIVPAGETVFFSDEKIVLDGGDQLWVKVDANSLLAVTVSALPV